MKQIKIIFAAALTAAFAFFATNSVEAATFTVTRSDDRNATCVSGTDCSLREAVNAANAASTDDVINFASSVSLITLASELVLTNNGTLLINGRGAELLKISGNGQTRVLTVGGGATVSITGLTIADGNANGASSAGNGGGILIQPTASLTLTRVTVKNNTASLIDTFSSAVAEPHYTTGEVVTGNVSGGGGGIYNRGNLVMIESAVTGNSMTAIGAQAFGSGGGIYNLTATAQLINSTVDGNQTITFNDGHGAAGGIYNGFQSTLTLTGSIVSNNVGRGNGGGINNNSQATLNLINSTISNNSALTTSGFGGAIINYATVNVSSSTIAGNFAQVTAGGVHSTFSLAVFTSKNTIYADNSVSGQASDFSGNFTSEGFNLLETSAGAVITGTTTGNILNVDPKLLPPGNYGGPTKTHALRPTSPAIDKGNSFGATVDQRQRTRPYDNPFIPNAAGGDGSDIGAFERQSADVPFGAPFDFDGDNKTDVGIFRPSDGSWWYSRSSDNSFSVFAFGSGSDIITPGDFTGDGRSDIAVFRPASGEWFVQRSEDNSFFSFPFGSAGDVPAPSDFDGDGKTDAAVFRPSSGTWFILNSGSGSISIVNFGTAGDKPVPADFDGDGRSDIAIFRPGDGSWWYLQSSDNQFKVYRFGTSTDKPVPGDYTGDGKADLAVWRPASGEWFFQRSEDNSYYSVPFGANGDVPAPGDYDGDGKFDTAVFRPSTADWFVNRSTAGTLITNFGANGDRPIPSAFVP